MRSLEMLNTPESRPASTKSINLMHSLHCSTLCRCNTRKFFINSVQSVILSKKAIILQQVHWHNEQKRLPRAKNPKYILNEIQSRVAHLYFSFITLVTTDTRLLLNVFHYHMVFVLKASDGLSRAP